MGLHLYFSLLVALWAPTGSYRELREPLGIQLTLAALIAPPAASKRALPAFAIVVLHFVWRLATGVLALLHQHW